MPFAQGPPHGSTPTPITTQSASGPDSPVGPPLASHTPDFLVSFEVVHKM